jgi:hypothetical protein
LWSNARLPCPSGRDGQMAAAITEPRSKRQIRPATAAALKQRHFALFSRWRSRRRNRTAAVRSKHEPISFFVRKTALRDAIRSKQGDPSSGKSFKERRTRDLSEVIQLILVRSLVNGISKTPQWSEARSHVKSYELILRQWRRRHPSRNQSRVEV